jgi:MFS family permease
MVVGWVIGVAVPLLLMWAPSWSWVVAANLLLGVHDGLTSSTLVIMTTDLVGPERRGAAMGVSAGAGYLGVAGAAFLAGLVAWRAGLRPEPFLVGLGCALAGLAIAVVLLRDTSAHVEHEASSAAPGPLDRPPLRETVAVVSVRDRTMSSCVQAGFFNQFNDAVAWGIFPLVFASRGLTLAQIATLAAIYPAVWGVGQFATGALSDAFDRRRVIAWGMWIQALALSLVVPSGGLATAGVAVVTLEGLGARRLPAVARRRPRRRCRRRRPVRGRARPARGDRRRRGADRGVGGPRRPPDARRRSSATAAGARRRSAMTCGHIRRVHPAPRARLPWPFGSRRPA